MHWESVCCILSHMNKTYLPWAIGGAVFVVIIGVFLFWKHTTPSSPVQGNATSTTATSVVSTSTGVDMTPGGTVKVVSITDAGATVPEYKTPPVCASDFDANTCAILKSQAATVAAQISAQPQSSTAWIKLGTIRKINLDYKGAEAAWLYVTKLYPGSAIAFANLGDLYMNFMHDYAKAEASYLMAIKDAPTNPSFYENLFSLYTTTSYKPSATAGEDILKKGITANPKSVDLQVMLARYYKSLGRSSDASAEYNAAIANAKAQGQTDLAAQIQAEAGK